MARPKMTVGKAIADAKAEDDAAEAQFAESQKNAETQQHSIANLMMSADEMPEDTEQFLNKTVAEALKDGSRTMQAIRTDAEALKQLAARARAPRRQEAPRAAPSLRGKRVSPSQDDSDADDSDVDDGGVEPHQDDETVLTSPFKEDPHVDGTTIRGILQRAEVKAETGAPRGKKKRERAAPPAGKEQFLCTACGSSVHVTNVQKHPLLGVGICDNCHSFIFSSPYTKDTAPDGTRGHENECRWCGDGGEVVLCDTCDKAFHKNCIKRNFGAEGLKFIEEPAVRWSCYYCDPNPLQPLQREYEKIEQLVKTMSHTVPPARRKRPYKRRQRRKTSGTSPNESISATISRLQEEMKRKNPGTDFSGFEAKKPRRPRLSPHSYAALMSRRPWSPKRMGNGMSFPSHERWRVDPKPSRSMEDWRESEGV